MTGISRERQMRTMTEQDIPAVMEIEERSFVSPWTRGMFAQTLDSSVARNYVMLEDRRITGYIVLYQAGLEMHIMNIAVDLACRRQGIALDMMERVLAQARANLIEECFLEVRESNFPAQGLYERLGFKRIGRRKGYYTETNEDAIVMVLSLT